MRKKKRVLEVGGCDKGEDNKNSKRKNYEIRMMDFMGLKREKVDRKCDRDGLWEASLIPVL